MSGRKRAAATSAKTSNKRPKKPVSDDEDSDASSGSSQNLDVTFPLTEETKLPEEVLKTFYKPPGRLLISGLVSWNQVGKREMNPSSMSHPNLYKFHKFTERRYRLIVSGCTSGHSVLVDENGQAYTFGRNNFGQLGFDDTKKRDIPEPVPELIGKNVIHAATGKHHTLFVTDTGAVYSCGLNKMGQCGVGNTTAEVLKPTRVRYSGAPIVKVGCGSDFSMILDCHGVLHSFGMPDNGRLGHNTDGKFIRSANKIGFDYLVSPKPIKVFIQKGRDGIVTPVKNVVIVDLSCGADHTVALDSSKRVFSWGFGGLGRLGHAEQRDESVPRLINTFSTGPARSVRSVHCGGVYSLAVNEMGALYLFGQQKRTGEANMYPKPVLDLSGWFVKSVGASHTSIVVAADDSVLAWGPSPTFGELGTGMVQKSSTKPIEVNQLQGVKVIQIASGYSHTLLLCDDSTEEFQERLKQIPELNLKASPKKSLAQRKFAQGAYVPPVNHTSVTPERKIDQPVSANKDATNIVLSNMSAKSLLDVISFKGLYLSSLQPTVVLDRLESIRSNSEIVKKAPVRRNPVGKVRSPVTRSKANKIVKKTIKARVTRKRKVLTKRTIHTVKKNKEADDFNNVEDNTPLKHFATTTKQPEAGNETVAENKSNQSEDGLSPNKITELATSIEPTVNVSNEKPTVNLDEIIDVDRVEAHTSTGHTSGYYGAQEIQKWMAESITQSPAPEVLEGFPEKAALISVADYSETITQEIPEPLQAESGSTEVCPCAKYIKIEDITRPENRSDFEKRCCKCRRCRCVEKLGTLSTLCGNAQSEPNDSNIYEFDTNADDVEEGPGVYQPNRRSPKAAVTSTEKGNFYIDMSQELAQIIEISRADENGIMHAKLVPRSEANPINEFSLIEHENLLDQLLATLKASNYRHWQGSILQLQECRHFEIQSSHPNETEQEFVDPVQSTDQGVEGFQSSNGRMDLMGVLEELHREEETERMQLAPHPEKPTFGVECLASLEDMLSVVSFGEYGENTNPSEDFAIPGSTNKATANEQAETKENILMSDDETGMATRALARSRKTAEPCSLSSATTLYSGVRKETEADLYSGLVDAPVYYPTAAEFKDPIKYIVSIMPDASKFGLCKVVAPPDFKPPCTLNEDLRFNVVNQYVTRLFSRWGSVARKTCAIKSYMAKQKVQFPRAPLLDGIEVNLPKLHVLVQRQGGIMEAIRRNRLARIAEQMGLSKKLKPYKKLELLYFKYLLPYAALTSKERQEILQKVDREWAKKNGKLLKRSKNPLHRKKRLLGDSESSDEEDTEEGTDIGEALSEAEDCVVPGRVMGYSMFKKIAKSAMEMFFPNSSEVPPMTKKVEAMYWTLVSKGSEHVCVNTASVDTGDERYVFTKEKTDKYSKHPWNLKMLSQNHGNVLRFLGKVLGVTVPTLHLGMVFSTSCWHRDPHGLPWMEYMHEGPGKVWYGIPNEQTAVFRQAIDKLCPTVCQSKPIWLPSDVTMVPPELLLKNNVALSRVVQHPGEFIIVFPKAYSCSISTGLTVSESVYFATDSWLNDVHLLFKKLKFCCEPTMFSLERLLVAVAKDSRVPPDQLNRVRNSLVPLIEEEQFYRNKLKQINSALTTTEYDSQPKRPARRSGSGWNAQEHDECEICRSTLFFAKVTGLVGKKNSVCLEHAVRLLSNTNAAPAQATLVKYFSDRDLETLLVTLEKRALSNH